MKKLLMLAILTTLLAGCDDGILFPMHDEGWHGRGHYEHGHDRGEGRGHYAHRGHGHDD